MMNYDLIGTLHEYPEMIYESCINAASAEDKELIVQQSTFFLKHLSPTAILSVEGIITESMASK
jgi:hypothetical protein